MEYRLLTKINKKISLLGFGTMRLPVTNEGKIERNEATRMIDYAYKMGVNYFDTAYPYHNGESELFTGEVLNKYPRDSYYLATKMPMWQIHTIEEAKAIFYEQLKRVDKEYIDFYLLHSMNRNNWQTAQNIHVLDFLQEMKQLGKIKYIGFSFHDDYAIFEDMVTSFNWDFCQIQLNYMDKYTQAGIKGVNLTKQYDIPLVIMEPIKGGTLANLPNDVKKIMLDYQPTASLSSWALRWVAQFPHILTILSGMSNEEQVFDNVNTFMNYQPLNKKENEIINEVEEILTKRIKNGCTGCRYCMPCPAGVNIPACFNVWNEYYKYDSKKVVTWSWTNIQKNNAGPDQCVKCGKCETLCPQHLSIREDLEKVEVEISKVFKE